MDVLKAIFFILLMNFSEGFTSVFISQTRNTETETRITCSITGNEASKYKVYLYCPIIKNSMCYVNCTPFNDYKSGKQIVPKALFAIKDCLNQPMDFDYLRVSYTINTNLLDENSTKGWYCSFFGKNSKIIKLNITRRATTTERINTKVLQQRVTQKIFVEQQPEESIDSNPKEVEVINIGSKKFKKVVPQKPTDLSVESSNLVVKKPKEKKSKEELDFKVFITRFEVVIGLICFSVTSIMINCFFCLRESLFKTYIDNLKSKIPSHSALLCCICQSDPIETSATAKLDRVLSECSGTNCSSHERTSILGRQADYETRSYSFQPSPARPHIFYPTLYNMTDGSQSFRAHPSSQPGFYHIPPDQYPHMYAPIPTSSTPVDHRHQSAFNTENVPNQQHVDLIKNCDNNSTGTNSNGHSLP